MISRLLDLPITTSTSPSLESSKLFFKIGKSFYSDRLFGMPNTQDFDLDLDELMCFFFEPVSFLLILSQVISDSPPLESFLSPLPMSFLSSFNYASMVLKAVTTMSIVRPSLPYFSVDLTSLNISGTKFNKITI